MLIKFVLLVCAVTVITASPVCDTEKCPAPLKHYQELGCKPVKSEGECCPSRYECPDFQKLSKDKCHFDGSEYNEGQALPLNASSCVNSCICKQNSNGPAKFECANQECDSSNKPGCTNIYGSLTECCPTNLICDEQEKSELTTCYLNNEKYYEGQKMLPSPCHECLCQKNFDNSTITNNPHCSPVNCFLQLRSLSFVQRGCIPVYYGENICCPIDWKCPEEAKHIPKPQQDSTSEQPPVSVFVVTPEKSSGSESTTSYPKSEEKVFAVVSESKPEEPKEKSDKKPEEPKENSESKPEEPKEKSDSKPEEPKEKSESKPEEPKEKSENKPEEPKEKTESKPEEPKEKFESKPEEPKEKSESKPEEPKEKSENKPEEPKEKSESKPEEPKEKSESKPEESKEKTENKPEEPKKKEESKSENTEIQADQEVTTQASTTEAKELEKTTIPSSVVEESTHRYKKSPLNIPIESEASIEATTTKETVLTEIQKILKAELSSEDLTSTTQAPTTTTPKKEEEGGFFGFIKEPFQAISELFGGSTTTVKAIVEEKTETTSVPSSSEKPASDEAVVPKVIASSEKSENDDEKVEKKEEKSDSEKTEEKHETSEKKEEKHETTTEGSTYISFTVTLNNEQYNIARTEKDSIQTTTEQEESTTTDSTTISSDSDASTEQSTNPSFVGTTEFVNYTVSIKKSDEHMDKIVRRSIQLPFAINRRRRDTETSGCVFDGKNLKVSEKIEVESKCLECVCELPPLAHCVKKENCHES